MKRTLKTLFVFALVITLLAGVLGCAGSTTTTTAGTTKSGTTGTAVATTTKTATPQNMTIRMFYHGEIDKSMATNKIDFNDNRIANFHRTNSGVNVKFETALADGTQELQKKAMILASNETPDLMDMTRDEYYKYASQGVLTETSTYLASMTDYTKLAGDTVINGAKIKGKLYAFPSVLEEVDLNRTTSGGIMVRSDILKSLGITEPTTINDFYTMWKTVKEKTDLIPLSTAGDNFSAIKAAFRVALDYKEVSGKLEYIWTQPEYKAYLTFMNKLYAEKLLDNEYITGTSTTLVEKFLGNKVFSSNQGWAFACVNIRDISTKIPGAEIKFLTQPAGANGEKALLANGWPIQRLWVIPQVAKNKDAAAKFMNYMATDKAKMTQDYGIEGTDYTLDASKKAVFTTEQNMAVTWRICYEVMATPASFKVRLVAKGYDWAYNQSLAAQKNAEITTNILGVLPTDEDFLKLKTQLALDTFITEQVTKFITGARPMSEFDTFVSELKTKGLDKQTTALNTWYAANK